MPIPQLDKLLEQWVAITGVDPRATSWRIHDLDISQINWALEQAIKLDPLGLTPILLLDHYLDEFMENRTLSLKQILEQEAVVDDYRVKLKALRSELRCPEILELRKNYEESMLRAVKRCGIERADVDEMIMNPTHLAFLRRDALRSMQTLRLFQFSQGQGTDASPVFYNHVFEFQSINDLVAAMRYTQKAGVVMAMIREENALHSFFAFALRNGERIIILSDKGRPNHPLAEGMSRRQGARLNEREEQHHFPYDILGMEYDYRGDAYIPPEKRKALTTFDEKVHMARPFAALNPNEVIWAILMFGLIEDKFWKNDCQAPKLTYTGADVVIQQLGAGVTEKSLVLVHEHQILTTPLTITDVSAEATADQWHVKPTNHNRWAEERYAHLVKEETINLTANSGDEVRYLPIPNEKQLMSLELEHVKEASKLAVFRPSTIGTAEEVMMDRQWYGRYNFALQVNSALRDEYERTRERVRAQLRQMVIANSEKLLEYAAKGQLIVPCQKDHGTETEMQNIFDMWTKEYPSQGLNTYGGMNLYGGPETVHGGWPCFVSGAAKTEFIAVFRPSTSKALAALCGVDVEELPEVLRHWWRDEPHGGNHILDRADPMEWKVKNLWCQLKFEVGIHLSRSGYLQIRKKHGLPPNKFWEETKK